MNFEWIDTETMLPKQGQEVLVAFNWNDGVYEWDFSLFGEKPEDDIYRADSETEDSKTEITFWRSDLNGGWEAEADVCYWMPIPELADTINGQSWKSTKVILPTKHEPVLCLEQIDNPEHKVLTSRLRWNGDSWLSECCCTAYGLYTIVDAPMFWIHVSVTILWSQRMQDSEYLLLPNDTNDRKL